MTQTQDEKLEILSDVLPEVNRFTTKAKNFQEVLNQQDAPDYVKRRSWRSLQRATTDLREALAHLTPVAR